MQALMKTTGLNGQYIACYKTLLTCEDFNKIIKSCDIIFTQMISDDYHNKFYLSTSNIIKKKKEDCKLFICGNNYMKFYYFDSFISKTLLSPNPYHHYSIIKHYQDLDYIINNIVNNIDFKNKEYLEQVVNNDFQELIKRENIIKAKYVGKNIYYIFTSEFIKNNFKKELLFYTINHPAKVIFQHMAEQINKIIKIKINYDIDPLKSNVKQILFKCIEKIVDFKIDRYITYNLKNYIISYTKIYENKERVKNCLKGKYESR
jgi:hypothetical protein